MLWKKMVIFNHLNLILNKMKKNTKDYIDYKDPVKEIDDKLIIKTREEAIPITNNVILMKKQKK